MLASVQQQLRDAQTSMVQSQEREAALQQDLSQAQQRLAQAEQRPVDELKRETFTVRKTSSLLGRYTTPDEVANLICYVCSPASIATNGASLRVDGGIVRNYI